MAQLKLMQEVSSEEFESIKPKRDIGIDIVKTIAILSVVGVHFFLNTKFYRVNLDNTNLFIQTIIQQICLTCIPLFVMSTGYLNNNTQVYKKRPKTFICTMVRPTGLEPVTFRIGIENSNPLSYERIS